MQVSREFRASINFVVADIVAFTLMPKDGEENNDDYRHSDEMLAG